MPEDDLRFETPMFRQYCEVKAKLAPGTLLLFRLGDFYEMFFDDAKISSNLLGLTLTTRNGRPMAGIPFHALNSYMRRLLKAGRRVALCDQMEDARPGKLVKRELTRVYSPGTVISDEHLQAAHNQYLLALTAEGCPTLKSGATNVPSLRDLSSAPSAQGARGEAPDITPPPEGGVGGGRKEMLSASWMDLSTGEWSAASSTDRDGFLNFLTLLQPAELIVPEENFPAGIKERLIENLPDLAVSELPNSFFEPVGAKRILCEALNVGTLKGFGLSDDKTGDHPSVGAAAALYCYAKQALCGAPANLKELKLYTFEDRLMIDPNTARQLELFKDLSGGKDGSLLKAMDSTVTSAGARLLERVMLSPSRDVKTLQMRYATVGALKEDAEGLKDLRESLSCLRDLERILSRLQNRMRSPRELAATRDTLRALPDLKQALEKISGENGRPLAPSASEGENDTGLRPATPSAEGEQNKSVLSWITTEISLHETLRQKLGAALEEEPGNDLTTGGYIRPGYDAELDRLKSLSANHKIWIAELERLEQERTGIKSLKVKYNQNFGFFIEVTKANLARVPADYIRKSTTVSGERYLTEALQERQKEILSAESNAIRREMELFETLVAEIVAESDALRRTASALAWCDLMSAFAYNAVKWNYCQPQVSSDQNLEIIGGRHPVVEQALARIENAAEKFVPNDTRMSAQNEQILLITGPNMAGKSTYIRQVALIVLMAQIGSWVPATSAKIGLVDRIFSRIGSSDALARGESTFMVEMTETAYILRSATEQSLIILDEIGRGTSTYDGLSIAWACVEFLHSHPSAGPRTLFATHYHELTRLEKTCPRLRNYTVSVKEWGGKIIFARTVVPGAADRSYGIHVAQLAGLPAVVIDRATKLLEGLEAQAKAPKSKGEKVAAGQGELFG